MTTVTQTAFADQLGVAKSYVTQLKKMGRLVMVDGRVDVEASLALLKQTQDPAKPSRLDLPKEAAVASAEVAEPTPEAQSPEAMNYQQSRALKERYQALAARRDYEQACAHLLVAADVAAIISRVGVTLRTRFEAFPDLLAPQLADLRDEQQIRSLLADHVAILLEDVSAQFARLARGEPK